MSDYEKAMLLLQMAQMQLLQRIAYQTQRNASDNAEINEIVRRVDMRMPDAAVEVLK